jgi:hypothetical protein
MTLWKKKPIAIARKYPAKPAASILDDLVEAAPGEDGKWFAAARSAQLALCFAFDPVD